jgi:hypothetical protein
MSWSGRRNRGSLATAFLALAPYVALPAAQEPSSESDRLEYPEPEISERIGFSNEVLRRLLVREYNELDEMAGELRSQKTRFRNGQWKLRWFYAAFSKLGGSRSWYPVPFDGQNPDWNAIFDRLGEWKEAKPKSVTPRIALAHAWNTYAWEARGRSRAKTVNEEQWALFKQRLMESSRVLDEARQLEEKCPEWFIASQTLALGQGWPRARVLKLVEDAVEFDPDYHGVLGGFAYYLVPRWYGEPGEWEAESLRWVARLGSPRGEMSYARTLWELRDLGLWDDLFEENDIDWPTAKRGFLALLERHPDSFEIRSLFAVLSVQAKDRPQARALMEVIGHRMDRGVWRSEKQFRWCRKWAMKLGKTPPGGSALSP